MTKDERLVEKLLLVYISERYKWETDAYNEMERLEKIGEDKFQVFKEFKPKLQNIYNRFLSTKERKHTLSYNKIGSTPYYNPKTELITKVDTKTKSKIIIQTEQTDQTNNRPNEYVFIKKNSEWKLDNKKTYWAFKEKWENAQL